MPAPRTRQSRFTHTPALVRPSRSECLECYHRDEATGPQDLTGKYEGEGPAHRPKVVLARYRSTAR